MSASRPGRSAALWGVAGAFVIAGLSACGDDGDAGADPTEPTDTAAQEPEADEPDEPTSGADLAIDCDGLDQDAVVATAGSEIVEVVQKQPFDGYVHSIGDQSFEGSSTGCDVDLEFGEFGPPELVIGLYAMEDDFYPFFKDSAQAEDSFQEAADVGDDAFVYQEMSSRSQIVVDLGGQTLTVSLSRGLSQPAPTPDDMEALALLAIAAIG